MLQRAYPHDYDGDGECDPNHGGCSYAHSKDSESCKAVCDSSGCKRNLVDAIGMLLKDERGIVGGFLDDSDNQGNLKAIGDTEEGVVEHIVEVAIIYLDDSDNGCDFIGVSFAANFFSKDIGGMVSVI